MGNTAGVAINNPTANVQNNVTTNINININGTDAQGNTTAPWVVTAAASGAALGAAMGGPAGALVGAALGAGAGMVRVHMGRQHGQPQHGQQQSLALWLPEETLRSITHAAAASESTTCGVCLDAQVAIALQPCGHACVCGGCALRLKRRAGGGSPACPVCRAPATGCHRVFI